MNATPQLLPSAPVTPAEALDRVAAAVITAEPELGRLYTTRELKARLGRTLWRLRIAGEALQTEGAND